MTASCRDHPPRKHMTLARRVGRLCRRPLLALLDIRARWWLALPLWLIAGVLLLLWCAERRQPFGHEVQGGGRACGVILRDGEFVAQDLSRYTSRDPEWILTMGYTIDVSKNAWTVSLKPRIARSGRAPYQGRHFTVEDLGSLAHDLPTPPTRGLQLPDFAKRDLQAWIDIAVPEMIGRGENSITRAPTLRVRAALLAITLLQIGAVLLMGIGVLAWFLRNAQIGHYRRALRRHDAGRCPLCNYDISPTPDLPCPECGCDHHAFRREALDALRRANTHNARKALAKHALSETAAPPL